MIFRRIAAPSISLTGERSSALDLARGRLVLVSTVFALAYILLAIRAFDLAVIQGPAFVSAPAESFAQGEDPAPEKTAAQADRRGDIFDRNGALLATTLKTASLYADTYLIADPLKAAEGLARLFPQDSYGAILQKLQSGRRFVWIRRNITPAQQRAVLELGEPGLEFEQEYKRIYPQGPLAAHMVGYTGIDNQGLAGIERSFDPLLAGGEPLTLSLDIRLQHALRRELRKAIDDFTAKAGAGVIMDVRSGEILAGVSWPDFDPNNMSGMSGDQQFNRLTLGVYELGSLFKIFSTAVLLETFDPPMSLTFDAREPIKIGRHRITDYHAQKREMTIPEVFMYSSNIGTALMGRKVGTERLRGFYRDLGLLSPLEFEIGEAGQPLVPEPWREVNTLTASYGHGVATTPLQLVTAVSSIVNDGILVRPRLVLGEGGHNNAASPAQNDPEIRIVSPKTSHRMRQLLRLTVAAGTGSMAEVPGLRLGGKTGTAEKTGARGGYDRKRLISSFVGVFPADAPRYAVFIMVDEPKGNKKSYGYATAGWVAAPAVARVATSMASILGIPANDPQGDRDFGGSMRQYVRDEEGKQLVSHER